MMIIDLGCGNKKSAGAIGVDMNIRSNADVIHNLDAFPYPFEDNTVDQVICHDVLEHVADFVGTMEEIWRISKPDTRIEVTAPFMSSVNFYSDPTHRRAFTSRSFDYFLPGTEVHKHSYSKAVFEMLSCEYDPVGRHLRRLSNRLLLSWANRHKTLYEERFAFIYPVYQIHFLLRVVK
jgi:SAM-dependent methyltransferase